VRLLAAATLALACGAAPAAAETEAAAKLRSYGLPPAKTQAAAGVPVESRPPASVAANNFQVTRPLGYYANRLGDGFMKDLAGLGGGGHWLDGGSGEGVAIEQYHQLGANPQALRFAGQGGTESMERIARASHRDRAYVTGVTYHMSRPGTRDYDGKLRHLVGRLLEDIPDSELGKADLISDVYGVFAYSNRLDLAMLKYLTALKARGALYIFNSHMSRSTVERTGRQPRPLIDFLRSIEGVDVAELGGGVYRVAKNGRPVRIPRLQLVSESAQTPPERRLRYVGGSYDVPEAAAGSGPGADFSRRLRFEPPSPAAALPAEAVNGMTKLLGYDVMEPR
jgi:hypothetical protein